MMLFATSDPVGDTFAMILLNLLGIVVWIGIMYAIGYALYKIAGCFKKKK